MPASSIVLAATLAMFGTQNMTTAPAQDTYGVINDCQITFIYDAKVPADLPAQQGGVLRSILVKQGDDVEPGTVLALVDNSMEVLTKEAAAARLAMSQEEALNDINVIYARKAAEFHEYKYRQVLEAVEDVPDSYSRTEVMTHALQWEQYKLQIDQALHEQTLAKMSVNVRKAEDQLAEHELNRRQIKAPAKVRIVEIYPHVGEWVRAGDPIAHVVQLDKLKIDGLLPYGPVAPASLKGKTVDVFVQLAGKAEPDKFTGTVTSVDPFVEQTGNFRIHVEVQNEPDENGDWKLMEGMRADMKIVW